MKELSLPQGLRCAPKEIVTQERTHVSDLTSRTEKLMAHMLPALERAADGREVKGRFSGATENFSEFAKAVPGLYVYLGITPPFPNLTSTC
jgi:amidohydrolase